MLPKQKLNTGKREPFSQRPSDNTHACAFGALRDWNHGDVPLGTKAYIPFQGVMDMTLIRFVRCIGLVAFSVVMNS
jgi:hypothetical protein